MKKLLNQFNIFCFLRKSFDLKMQDVFETSNQKEYIKCVTKFCQKPISRLEIIESIQ